LAASASAGAMPTNSDAAIVIQRRSLFAIRPLCAGLAAAARIDQGEKHR
jgi:hypothetical protein